MLFFTLDIGLIQDSSLHYLDRQGMDDAFKYAIKTFNNDQSLRQDSVILKSKGHNVTDIDNSYQLTRQSNDRLLIFIKQYRLCIECIQYVNVICHCIPARLVYSCL